MFKAFKMFQKIVDAEFQNNGFVDNFFEDRSH